MLRAKSLLCMPDVTWPVGEGVKNDYIFGIPNATLPIHYTTSMGLQWRLSAVYRWKFYTGAFVDENLSIFAPIFDFGVFFRG